VADKLIDLVNFLFSKNAGPYLITFDVLFKNDQTYARGRRSGFFTRERIAERFRVPPDRILSIHEYDAARAIKFTMIREVSSGDFGDPTVFGSQHWPPLIDVEIP
jgi:hypothetical protein